MRFFVEKDRGWLNLTSFIIIRLDYVEDVESLWKKIWVERNEKNQKFLGWITNEVEMKIEDFSEMTIVEGELS
jgi:hypothetical protein